MATVITAVCTNRPDGQPDIEMATFAQDKRGAANAYRMRWNAALKREGTAERMVLVTKEVVE